jgi:hypothetical protein
MLNKIKTLLLTAILFGLGLNMQGAVGKLLNANLQLGVGEQWTASVPVNELLRTYEIVGKFNASARQMASKDAPSWWVELLDAEENTLTKVEVGSVNSLSNFNDSRDIVVTAMAAGAESLSMTISNEKSGNSTPTAITFELADDGLQIWTGCNELALLGELPLPAAVSSVKVAGNVAMEILTTNMDSQPDLQQLLQTGHTEASLRDHFATATNPKEGFYDYMDGSYETNRYRKGGDYRLALVANADGGFDVIYIGGAVENVEAWQPGMLKGKLTPTKFVDNYNLLWYDSELNEMSEEQWATLTLPMLDLNFPLSGASMRFVHQ